MFRRDLKDSLDIPLFLAIFAILTLFAPAASAFQPLVPIGDGAAVGTGIGPGFAPVGRGVAQTTAPEQDTSFVFEFKSASARYTDPGVGAVSYWDAPIQTLRASQSIELSKPTLSGNALVFGSAAAVDYLSVALAATTSRAISVVCRAKLETNPGNNGPVIWYNGQVRGSATPYPYNSLFTFANYVEMGNWGSTQIYWNPSNYTATKTWICVCDNASGTAYEDGVAKGTQAWGAAVTPESWLWHMGPGFPNGVTISYFAVYNRTLTPGEIATVTSALASEYP